MLTAFAKAVGQLSDPKTRGLVWLSLALAVCVFVVLLIAVSWLLTSTALFELVWLDAAIDVLGGLAVLVVVWLLFPAVVSAFVGVFLDSVADAVERRHYPELPPPRDVPLGETIATSLRFLAVMVAVNALVLLFLVPPFSPLFPFVFYAANGYLLGREYFEMVASRRADPNAIRSMRGVYRGRLFLAGLVIAFLLTIPFVNLLAPIIGTAAMVHLFETWRYREGAAGSLERAVRLTR